MLKLLLLIVCSVCIAQPWEPVPADAIPNCQNCSTKGYDIIPIADGVWAVTEYAYWSLVVLSRPRGSSGGYHRGSNGNSGRTLAVVDSPPSFSVVNALEEILEWTGASTVSDVILSHHHLDHVGSSGEITARWPEANVIAHTETKRYIENGWGNGNRALPTVTFKKSLRLNNFGLELEFPFQTHSSGNIITWHPASKTLMFVDVIFPRWLPFKNLAVSENIPGFFKAYSYILDNYDFETYVGGHLTVLGDRDSVEEGKRYMDDLKAAAEKGLAEVDPTAIIADLGTFDPNSPNYYNLWGFLDTYIMAMAQVCYDELFPKYQTVLGGSDVFTLNHCETMIESLRID